MAIIDVADSAAKLHVVSVFQAGNESGIVTDPSKYQKRPANISVDRAVRHGTAGRNSLTTLALPPSDACIPFLIPTKASDPRPDNWTVYKLIPDDCYGFHVGEMNWEGQNAMFWHPRAWGFELENVADDKHEIEQRQYIKAALLYAHDCAVWKWQDYMVFDHATIAVPHTDTQQRRTDPKSSLFRESIFWDYVTQVRNSWPWGNSPAQWYGGNQF